MSEIGSATLRSFQSTLEKLSFSPRVGSALGSAGALGGLGLGVGALGGAAIGGIHNYREARARGEGVGSSIGQGVSGALGGAGKGALVGGLSGMAAGAGAGVLSPDKAEAMRHALSTTKVPVVGSFARFGQRQVHGITGWKPQAGLREIRLGAQLRENAVDAARDQLAKARAGNGKRSLMDMLRGRSAIEGAEREMEAANKAYLAAHKAEEMGLTSIPGYIKSLRTNGVGNTVATGFKEQWHGAGPGTAVMAVGLPALNVVHDLRSGDDPNNPGHRAERLGASLGQAASGALLGPMSLGTQALVGATGGQVGKAVDALGSKSRAGKVQPPPFEVQPS